MSDPIILDKNVITSIARNNKPVAEALKRYLDSGTTVYIARPAYDELVTRAQNPRQAGEYQWLLKDAGIATAPSGKQTDRQSLLADNIEQGPAPYRPQLKTFARPDDPGKPGDAFVAAQAKATGARLWTLDGKLKQPATAAALGYKLAPECSLSDISGTEDPSVARNLLGMNPRLIGADGRPMPTGEPASGGGGQFAVVGVADNAVPEAGGPSAKGLAIVGGIQLAFEGINFALNLVNDEIQRKKANEALERIKPDVKQSRLNNPRLGVVLLFYYTQYLAPDESIIKPGAAFDYVLWGKGVTRDEALRDVLSQPSISAGGGPNVSRFSRDIWIPPLQKSVITAAKSPFAPLAIGRFFLGNSKEAKFQLVSFDTVSGFDDIREKTVELPDNMNPDFAVLKVPSQVFWYNMNGRQTVEVPLKEAKTANGNVIKVVDLDPWSPFNAKAVMVFPVNDLTEQVFGSVSPTDGRNMLSTYVNFDMIRWVRPENIHLLKFL
jgi:predicted nucleic acid-binding protein